MRTTSTLALTIECDGRIRQFEKLRVGKIKQSQTSIEWDGKQLTSSKWQARIRACRRGHHVSPTKSDYSAVGKWKRNLKRQMADWIQIHSSRYK
jgi:hypothetical protein